MSHKDRKISFVETSNLKVLKSREQLKKLLRLQQPLKGYDLSGIALRDLDFSGLRLEDVVFNYFDVKRKERKEIFNVNFKGCSMKRVSFAHCSFCRCNFDSYSEKLNHVNRRNTEGGDADLSECDFFFCEFENCRFINTKMRWVDFRYSSFTDCSMRCAQVTYGDFYMTAFHGTTNFPHSVFKLCSLTNATFDTHCLLMENIHRLIQEDYELYSRFIRKKNWSKHNPCADFSELDKAEADLCKLEEKILEEKIYLSQEAKFIYTTLSGLYSGKGLFRDSNKAYSKAKKCEAQYYKLLQKKALQKIVFWSWLKKAWQRIECWLKKTWQGIECWLKKAWQRIECWLKKTWQRIECWLKKAWQRIECWSWVKNVFRWVDQVSVMLIAYGYAYWSLLVNVYRWLVTVFIKLLGYGYAYLSLLGSLLGNVCRWLVTVFIKLLGYGYKLLPVVALLMIVWFAEALSWIGSHAVSICNSMALYFEKIKMPWFAEALSWIGSHAASICNSMAPYFKLAPVLTRLETLLIGLLGFVIANKIRNNS